MIKQIHHDLAIPLSHKAFVHQLSPLFPKPQVHLFARFKEQLLIKLNEIEAIFRLSGFGVDATQEGADERDDLR